MKTLVEISKATIRAPGGRPLFDELTLQLSRERVALIGRNGVGKSTLLDVLAGVADVDAGSVKTLSPPHYVPQALNSMLASDARTALSQGERRRAALNEA